jgi:hypothetical protein
MTAALIASVLATPARDPRKKVVSRGTQAKNAITGAGKWPTWLWTAGRPRARERARRPPARRGEAVTRCTTGSAKKKAISAVPSQKAASRGAVIPRIVWLIEVRRPMPTDEMTRTRARVRGSLAARSVGGISRSTSPKRPLAGRSSCASIDPMTAARVSQNRTSASENCGRERPAARALETSTASSCHRVERGVGGDRWGADAQADAALELGKAAAPGDRLRGAPREGRRLHRASARWIRSRGQGCAAGAGAWAGAVCAEIQREISVSASGAIVSSILLYSSICPVVAGWNR